MKPHSDNELDFLFKSKLTTPKSDQDFLEEEWRDMESILSPEPRKNMGVIWLYRISGSIAASLLLYLSIHFAHHTLIQPTGNKLTKTDGYSNGITNLPKNQHPENGGQNVAASHQIARINIPLYHITKQNHHHTSAEMPLPNTAFTDSAHRGGATLQALNLTTQNMELQLDDKLLAMAPVSIDPAKNIVAIYDKKPLKINTPMGPRFVLAVLAAPDINGVSSFGNSQTGLNLTVQLSLKLSSKLSITTGAAYVTKPYQTGFANYKTASPGWGAAMWTSNAKPNTVTANCYVLDIPLNINYQLYSKGNNSFTIGTGLSSYLMLKEDYRFSFPDPAKNAVNLDISNQNQHLLGVLNMDVNYQHQLNNKLGIVLQPYLKLPLTQIGFGQVDLRSAGVAVGFNWNIK
jgi:hypothetical protein